MENIIGHELAKQKLVSNKSLQSWLICGKKGIGKATLAKSFASLLLTENTSSTCDNHPDLLIIKDSTIGIESIRHLKNFLYLSPMQSNYKVVIIDSIEAMNNNSKNAILKILEEPIQNAVILIISHKPYDISTTIKSRCFQITLSPLNYDETKRAISSDRQFSDEILSLFYGLPGVIISTTGDEINDLYQCLLKILQGVSNFDIVNRITSTSIELGLIAYILQNLILKIMKDKIGMEVQMTANEKLAIKNIGCGIEYWYEKWQQITNLLISAEKLHLDKNHTLVNLVNIITY